MVSRSLEVSWPRGKGDGFLEYRLSLNTGQPPLASGDSMLTYSQNVAGLWLKCGQRPET
jgi:hypothetical protein